MRNKGNLITLGIVLSLFLIFVGPVLFKVLEFSGNAKEYISHKYSGVKMHIGWALPELIGTAYSAKVKVLNPQGDFLFYVNLDSDGNVTSDGYLYSALQNDIKFEISKLLNGLIPNVVIAVELTTPPNDREYFITHDKINIVYTPEAGHIYKIVVLWKEKNSLSPIDFANKSIVAAKKILAKYDVLAFSFSCQVIDKEEIRLEFYKDEMNQPVEQLVSKIKTYTSK